MNATAEDHYNNHLGPFYEWMAGDFVQAADNNRQWFQSLPLPSPSIGGAIDLGCGHGLQSLPLADLGYQVTAIDFCEQLLQSLQQRSGQRPVRTVQANLQHYQEHVTDPAAIVCCMGDTLTHLPRINDVLMLIQQVATDLAPQGLLCLSFRNYVDHELTGVQRFIPVKADANRIHTCFLEYLPDQVRVHDLIHQQREGNWQQTVSAYHKLRLSPDVVTQHALQHGLTPVHESVAAGMLFLALQKQ